MKNRTINIIKLLLPIIFIAYLGSRTMFTHIHNIDGVFVVHSHPFKALHKHSITEFETISILSNIQTSCFTPFFELLTIFFLFICTILLKRDEFILPTAINAINLRAPPSLN